MRISVKLLADFMTASPARQRTIIRDAKYPQLKNGKKRPQIVRYSEARAAIRDYHEANNDVSVLLAAIERLNKKKAAKGAGENMSRIDDNIRVLTIYMKYYSKTLFTILTTPKLIYGFEQVEVSAAPDLYVEEAGEKKLIKIDLNQKKLREDEKASGRRSGHHHESHGGGFRGNRIGSEAERCCVPGCDAADAIHRQEAQ